MNKPLLFLSFAFMSTVVAYADAVTVPNTFTTGTPAKASEVNANFNALVNAVNSAPKPLMVYDGTGKLVGQFITDNSGVLISMFGAPFAVTGIYKTGYVYGYSVQYYATNDCSGEFYIDGNPNYLVPYAKVFGTAAYIPSDDQTSISVNSERASLFNGVLGSCTSYQNSMNRLLSSVSRIVDLSIFTSPFSVH